MQEYKHTPRLALSKKLPAQTKNNTKEETAKKANERKQDIDLITNLLAAKLDARRQYV